MMASASAMETERQAVRPQDQRSDLELIAAVNAGEAGAFDGLYHRHRDWVVALAYRFTGAEDLALDVMQETFLYFLRKFPGFRLTANLRTFLYPAVRNLSLTARRKAARLQSTEQELEMLAGAPAPATPTGDGHLLAAALASLVEEHREVLLLRFVDGLTLGEIALALDIPAGTVKSRLHYALASLRENPATRQLFEP
jgi:RNA polymerase sigma-70 factor, ECF subfamily